MVTLKAGEDDVERSDDANTDVTALPVAAPDLATSIILHIRDVSSVGEKGRKHIIIATPSWQMSSLFSEIGRIFKYDPTSFSLVWPLASEVDLRKLPSDQMLSSLAFEVGRDGRNNLVICDDEGQPPRKTEEDDLSLGASASPTFTYTVKPWYDVCDNPQDVPALPEGASKVASATAPTEKEGRTINLLQSGPSQESPVNYVGLVNQAMTCYLNSLLQTLFMTPEFRNALYRWEFTGTEEEALKSIPFQLQKLFLQLQTTARSAVETTSLTRSFGWDSSEAWQQHDIQELCRVMFDALEQCFKNTDQADLINNLYEGKMKDYVKCLECDTENAREDTFLDIPLPIRPFGSNSAFKSVEEALKAFVEPELLTENNKYECSKCKSLNDAHKGLKFTRFPYLLTIHLKRFDFDYQTFHRIKLNDEVTFPSRLDLNDIIETVAKDEAAKIDPCGDETPDKGSTDKVDDASITDSGSAFDAEESNSVELTSTQSQTDLDTQDEDEGIDVSSIYNEKNKLCASNGPFVYELFSIMIHSGSASGGHYYAYIKDFKTDDWFCFNDQTVCKITYDDIRKTYGGSNTRGYYWSSSANAYMLMYRQADKERNVQFLSNEELPSHIQDLSLKMASEEEAEKEAKEIERSMMKVKVFFQEPKLKAIISKKLRMLKETTLREATKLAYEELNLEYFGIPLERCRLVQYEDFQDIIECSFENQDESPITEVLGSCRTTYKCNLLMEVRDKDKEFEEYKPGGTTVKVCLIDLATQEVEGPHTVRVSQNLTVHQFKEFLGRHFACDSDKMRIVQERYGGDYRLLSHDALTLKAEGFYRSSKVFIESSGEEANNVFADSMMHTVLDRYEHTIILYCHLPDSSESVLQELQIPPYSEETTQQIVAAVAETEAAETPVTPPCPSAAGATALEKPLDVDESTAASLTTATSLTNSVIGSAVASSISANVSSSSSLPHPVAISNEASPSCSSLAVADSCQNSTNALSLSPSSIITSQASTAAPAAPASSSSSSLSSSLNAGFICGVNLSDGEDEGIMDMDGANNCSSSTVNSDQSASEDSSLTSDSDRTLVGDPPEDKLSNTSESPDYHNVSSPEDNTKDKNDDDWALNPYLLEDWRNHSKEEIRHYFKAHLPVEESLVNGENKRVLTVSVDKRINVGQLKKELQHFVGVSQEHFKLNKFYSNSTQEFECSRMSETLSCYGENAVMRVQLARALLPGEYKCKVYMLDFKNSEDPALFLIDFVIRNGDLVSEVKESIVKEVNSKCLMELKTELVWLRKKSWKNPFTIYLDSDVFGEHISLFSNWEIYLQVLTEPRTIDKDEDELAIFVKRWRGSSWSTEAILEIIVKQQTIEAVKEELSTLSEISAENILIAKGKGPFPCDMSVLDIEADLDWTERSGPLEQAPLGIRDDGAVLYYKDRLEKTKSLTEAEKNELSKEENLRLNREQYSSTTSTSSLTATKRSKERGLRIYLDPQ